MADNSNEPSENGFYAVNENNEKTKGPFDTYSDAYEASRSNEAVFSELEYREVTDG